MIMDDPVLDTSEVQYRSGKIRDCAANFSLNVKGPRKLHEADPAGFAKALDEAYMEGAARMADLIASNIVSDLASQDVFLLRVSLNTGPDSR